MTVYYKMRQIFLQNAAAILLQNASGFLLQNETVLLQNATVISSCDNFITKCGSYYKMRRILQIVTVHAIIYHYLACLFDCIVYPKHLMRDFLFIDFSASKN